MRNPKKVIWHTILICFVVAALCWSASAQRIEFFGGYQFTHLQPSYNANGWNASITGNFKHILGITGDFSGAYKDNTSVYTYTIGPVLQARLPVAQPFVHALFGGMKQTDGTSISAFTMMIGGGIDVGLRKGIGIRLIQADWIHTDFYNQSQNRNVRGSAGIVLKF